MYLQKTSTVALMKLLCSTIFFFFPFFVYGSTYTVSPILINHDLEKRDIITETIVIENKGGSLISLFPTVNEVTVNEGGSVLGFVSASESDRTKSVTSWLEISRAEIELRPGERKELVLTIRVNPEAESGEYHAFVGFPQGGNRPEAEKLVYENRAQGTVVRIGINKEQNQFLKLEKFTVERFVKDNTEGAITISLQNPGEDPVVPSGEIIFYDNNGNEVGATPFNTESLVVESKKVVTFTQEVPKDLKMGKYKAFLSVEYGEHQKASLNDTTFFYVLPLKQLAIGFGVVLLLAVLLALYVHRRFDREEDNYGASDVAMYVRTTRSESKDHDIDLSKKNLE